MFEACKLHQIVTHTNNWNLGTPKESQLFEWNDRVSMSFSAVSATRVFDSVSTLQLACGQVVAELR